MCSVTTACAETVRKEPCRIDIRPCESFARTTAQYRVPGRRPPIWVRHDRVIPGLDWLETTSNCDGPAAVATGLSRETMSWIFASVEVRRSTFAIEAAGFTCVNRAVSMHSTEQPSPESIVFGPACPCVLTGSVLNVPFWYAVCCLRSVAFTTIA